MILTCDLREKQERKRSWFNSDEYLCKVDKVSIVLIDFCQLDRNKSHLGRKTLIGKYLSPSGCSLGTFSSSMIAVEGLVPWGGSTSEQVVQGAIKCRLSKPWRARKPVSSISSSFVLQFLPLASFLEFLPWHPSMIDTKPYNKISPFLPKLLLVIVFVTLIQNIFVADFKPIMVFRLFFLETRGQLRRVDTATYWS